MEVRSILLDTNAYGAFLQGTPEAIRILQHVPLIALSSVVLGELMGGFSAGSREKENRDRLRQFLDSERVQVFNVDQQTSEHYAAIYLKLRRRGTPIPTNDIWIAATALQHNLAIFTFDGHFSRIDGLTSGSRIEDFLVAPPSPG